MHAPIALFTAISLFIGYAPGLADRTASTPIAANSEIEVLDRNSYTDDQGREVDFVLWLEDGELFADISIIDPATGDWLEMWLEKESFRFEGSSGGEPFSGSEPASSFYDTSPDAPTCAGWVAIICAGAALALLGPGCQYLSLSCVPDDDEPTNVPGGAGEGGGGDGESGDGDGDGGG